MKHILFISSRPIYPILGGDQIRTAQQLEFLSTRYNVQVVYLTNNKNEYKNTFPSNIQVLSFYVPKWLHYLYTLRAIFNNRPLQVNYYYHYPLQKFINQHINEYDAVFCNNIRTSEYARKHQGVIKYLDFVDAISMNYDKARQNAHGLKKIIYIIPYNYRFINNYILVSYLLFR